MYIITFYYTLKTRLQIAVIVNVFEKLYKKKPVHCQSVDDFETQSLSVRMHIE